MKKKQPIEEDISVPFTARLMAHYRAQENKLPKPLIKDPFAERLAGDLETYSNKHKYTTGRGDYSIVRSFYIENELLTPWCNETEQSQIVLLGAGLDTRAYRLKALQENSHILFEIDLPIVLSYKEEILKDERPLCKIKRISADLSNLNWTSVLINNGFSEKVPTFWILEGLIYYMEQFVVASLLAKIAKICGYESQIFADICVPILAEVNFGPFMAHFKWGLEMKTIPSFFAPTGWNVSCSWADDHDQDRDVGQKGLIFIQGIKSNS